MTIFGRGAEQHFNPRLRLQTAKHRQRYAQADRALSTVQFEQRLLLHPAPSKTPQIAQETGSSLNALVHLHEYLAA